MLAKVSVLLIAVLYHQSIFASVAECTGENNVAVSVNAVSGSTGTTHEIILKRPNQSDHYTRVHKVSLGRDLAFLGEVGASGALPAKLLIEDYSPSKSQYNQVALTVRGLESSDTLSEFKLRCSFSTTLSHKNICQGKSQSNNLLLSAARESNVNRTEQALACGADINHADRNGCTPLISAIEADGEVCRSSSSAQDSFAYSRREYIANRLLDLGAYYDVVDKVSGQSVVHRAASFWNNGDFNILKLLIAVDADVNVQDRQGLTPIMLAARNGLRWSVEALLEAQPDLSLTDVNGKTAYDLASRIDSETRDKLAAVKTEITIEGHANGTCSPLTVQLPLGERVRLTMKASSNSMFMLTVPGLKVELMAGAGDSASKVIEVKSTGTFPFDCGVHGGTQSKGKIIAK